MTDTIQPLNLATESDQQFQEINISARTLLNIQESIVRIQELERVCRDGTAFTQEYFQIPEEQIPKGQYIALRASITELGILLRTAKPRLDKKFFLHAKVHLRQMRNQIDMGSDRIFVPVYNQVHNMTVHYLSEEYWDMLEEIGKIVEKVNMELAPIFHGIRESKIDSMDKTKMISPSTFLIR